MLKATGYVRTVSTLGDVVIPHGLRLQFGINEGDKLEFFTDAATNRIVIQKCATSFERKFQLAKEIHRNHAAVDCVFRYHGRDTICAVFNRRNSQMGIARCRVGDKYNATIGEAIALLRALGKEVPPELLD